ncbi:MAG: lysophospholipid acyltransferase family protein [Burkholderiaceae bacterium]
MIEFIFRRIAALPLSLVHAIGGGLGTLVYWFSGSYRRRLRENLAQAGYDPVRFAAAARREAGRQALETPWVWMRPRADMLAKVSVAPADRAVIDDAMAEGRPIVFLTPHLGCFEVTVQWFAASVAPASQRSITVLYRVPRKPVLRQIVAAGRVSDGIVLAPADVSGVRKLMRAMKTGQAVGILPDQVPSNGDGVWAPFFGRPAYTMTLPSKLARQFDGIVLFIWGERLPQGAGWRVHARRLAEALTGDPAHDAAAMNRGLETMVHDKPEQYLWGYNRYKVPGGVKPPEQDWP